MRIAPFVLLLVVLTVGPMLGGAVDTTSRVAAPVTSTASPAPSASPSDAGPRPSFVLINTDDLSEDLVPYMANLQAMMREGWSAENFLVNNSLCCPSRVSLFTGRYTHNTGVTTNDGPRGGWRAMQANDLEADTVATDLQRAGYRTGLFGKYVNGYRTLVTVPQGWDRWMASSNPYDGYGYRLSHDGVPVLYDRPDQFQPEVLTDFTLEFVDRSVAEGRPFFAYLAPGQPHDPSVHTLADAAAYQDVERDLPPTFGRRMTGAPQWLSEIPDFTPTSAASLDAKWKARLYSSISVDRMLGRIRAHLAARGLDDVYVLFTSDNGFHLGQHLLRAGKQTPYEYDVNVPLVVSGPGVAAGASYRPPVQNVDLRATLLDLAGLPPAATDGVPIGPVLDGTGFAGREVALLEHEQTIFEGPDFQGGDSGRIPDYSALRLPDALYVEYAKEGNPRQYHDLRTDPYQLRNTYGSLSPERKAWLAATVDVLSACVGAQCARLPLPAPPPEPVERRAR